MWAVAKFPIIGLSLLLIFCTIMATFMAHLGEGRDTIAEFGDGKYELGKADKDLVLEDHRFNDGKYRLLVTVIEKYSVVGSQIYLVGDFTDGYCAEKDELSRRPCRHMDFATGEYFYYKKGEPVPRYTVLDFQNDKLRTYVKLEDVPPEDQAVFDKAKVVEGAVEARASRLEGGQE
jgi:hypothetical protein